MARYLIRANGAVDINLRSPDPVAVEAEYFRWVRIRTETPGIIRIESSDHDVVAPALYRIGTSWDSQVHREGERVRLAQIWTWTVHPTIHQIRGLTQWAGKTQAEMAKIIAVSPRRWRQIVDGTNPPSKINPTHWMQLLCHFGFITVGPR